ncbi:hypothetical protein GTV15_04545 [Streptomyces sp. SID7803]|nr:hypothetical protein [Streptomyces sp. SID7803]
MTIGAGCGSCRVNSSSTPTSLTQRAGGEVTEQLAVQLKFLNGRQLR